MWNALREPDSQALTATLFDRQSLNFQVDFLLVSLTFYLVYSVTRSKGQAHADFFDSYDIPWFAPLDLESGGLFTAQIEMQYS